MKKDNHIDKIFQEKLHQHQVTPPPALWAKLEKELDKKQPKKRIAAFYWQAAASMTLAVGVSLWVWKYQNNDNESVVSKVASVAKTTNQQTNKATSTLTPNVITPNKQLVSIENKTVAEYSSKNTKTVRKNKLPQTNHSPAAIQPCEATTTVQLVQVAPKELPTPVILETATTPVAMPQEVMVEIIVKVNTDDNTGASLMPTEVATDTVPQKRKGLGRIWQKLREGELLTLQDVGIDKNKLPRLLRKEN